ncbi:MAG: hypothetical protein B0D91_15000 [Oceanospirillales bacterium LUC14_002_19_P2]|nr:MAG: hypothetical protein B0D91_15000 [Oceanospirillales bacterium LUC14_002_19_P2]
MNMPIVVGEFGVGASQPGAGDFIDDVTLMADYMGSGWAYWSNDRGGWSPTDGSDNETIVAEHLTRTYPRAIAGQPVDYYFEAKSKEFRLVYDEKPGVTGPTEIYIPASRYYQLKLRTRLKIRHYCRYETRSD